MILQSRFIQATLGHFFLASLVLFCSIESVFSQDKTLESTGDVFLFTLPATVLSATFFEQNNKGSYQFVKGLLFNELITYGLKLTVNKTRPDLSNENSFPSGHTSTVFHSASFLHKRYGFKKAIPAYLIAGFTAFTRINAEKHDGWDILAGSLIGVASTMLFTTPYQKQKFEFTFSRSNNIYQFGLKYKI